MAVDEILNTLHTLYDQNDVIEIRIIRKKGKSKSTDSGYYDYSHFDKCAEDISKMDGLPGVPAIYCTVNPVQKILLARSHNRMTQGADSTTNGEQIKYRKYLPFDIDPVRPTGTSSTDEMHDKSIEKAHEVKQWLGDKGFPKPIIADSGNGAHLLYRIDEPNTPETKELIENAQKAVITALNHPDKDGIDIQGFADANRIWKVYGTITKKGDEIKNIGVRHRRSKLLEVPDNIEIISTEILKKVGDLYKKYVNEVNHIPKDDKPKQQSNRDKFDIEAWMDKYNIHVVRTKHERNKTIYVLETCPLNSDHSGNKEAVIIQEDSGRLGFKCHHNSCNGKGWIDVREKYEPGYNEPEKNLKKEIIPQTESIDNKDKPYTKCRYFRSGINDKNEEWAKCALDKKWLNPFSLKTCDKWEQKKEKQKTEKKTTSFYFDDKNKFIPKILGDEILQEFDIITYQDTKEIAVYINGVFHVNGGEDNLRLSILKKLHHDFKRDRINEVIEYIKLNTLIKREEINPVPLLINLKNGMYDVLKDILLPHDPILKSTIQLNVEYTKDAQCKEVDKYLYGVVAPDDVPVLVQYAGYCCIPDIKQQRALLIDGPMQNGKSTFIDLVCALVGQEHVSEQSIQALNSDRFARAQLNGKLINMFPDLPKKKIYDNSVFKMLTTDQWIDGEEKYIRKFRFKNTTHQIYSANQVPDVADPDELAFFRRWIIITFPNIFEGKKADKNLLKKITTDEELSGFFNIVMVGLRALLEHEEFCYTPNVKDVRKIYLTKSNPVQAFLNECTFYSNTDCIKQELYETYLEWCELRKITTTLKNNIFARKLKKMNYDDGRSSEISRVNVWKNLGYTLECQGYVRDKSGTLTDFSKSIDTDNIPICQGSQVKEDIVLKYREIYNDMYLQKEFVDNNPDMAKNSENPLSNGMSGLISNPDITLTDKDYIERTNNIINDWYNKQPENPIESIKYIIPEIVRQTGISLELAHKSVTSVFQSKGWIKKTGNESQRDTVQFIRSTIQELQTDGKTKTIDVQKHAGDNGISQERFERTIKNMKTEGAIFEPKEGYLKCT